MIDRLASLFTDFDATAMEPVTVRCRVIGEPQLGTEGGRKTLYRITDPVGDVPTDTFLSFWQTTPFDGALFEQTDTDILSLVIPERDETPLEYGEDVLVRGIPNYSEAQDRYFINVTSLLIRQPDLQIGKGQLRMPNECERLIHLLYEKNVYRPRDSFGGNTKTSGSFRGRIAHKALEYAVTRQPYRDYFDQGLWDRDAVKTLIEDVLENEFLIEQALHSLRWTGTNSAIDGATDAVETLVSSQEVAEIVTDATTIRAEAGLAQAYGFDGQVDLIADGIPYDLKTGIPKQVDRFQMKLYLFALLLEQLEPGQRVQEELDGGITGALVYTDEDESETRLERIELSNADVTNLMQLRNSVVVARSQFGVPSPYDQDCDGCILRTGDDHGGLDEEYDPMPSACKFHCQSERRWPCYGIDSEYGFDTKCPLFDECDQRFEFRDPDITDHYNELRAALTAERQVRRDVGDFLSQLTDDTLTRAGLLLPELTISEFLSDRRVAYTSPRAVSGLEAGTAVELSQTAGSGGWTAIYLGQRDGEFIFEFDTQPSHRATIPDTTYEARRTPRSTAVPKKYLRHLDFAQRTGTDPRLRTSDDDFEDAGASERLSSVDQIDFQTALSKPEVFVDLPVRTDRDAALSDLVESAASSVLQRLDSDGTVPYGSKRTLVLCARPVTVDQLDAELATESGYVRFDGAETGERSLPGDRTQHEIKEELKSSRLVLSSTQFAVTEELFHYMASGDPEYRTHSSKFFDTVVILGADRVSEPAYHFLSKLADRTLAVADLRRRDIELLSQAARDADLTEPYFKRAFERYNAVDTTDVSAISLNGHASRTALDALADSRLEALDSGTVDFVDCPSTTDIATETMIVETSVQRVGDTAYRVGFEAVNPSSTAADIAPVFDDMEQLDATTFTPGEQYILSDTTLNCIEHEAIDNESAALHQVSIRIPVASTPYLSSRLLSNQSEAESAVSVALDRDADVILTPYTSQAAILREETRKRDTNLTVTTTAEWAGEIVDTAVVSPVVANGEHVIHPPLNEYETLYTILTAGESVTIVGDHKTLRSNDILRDVVDSSSGA